jgi:low temperature requirement protein LtrA
MADKVEPASVKWPTEKTSLVDDNSNEHVHEFGDLADDVEHYAVHSSSESSVNEISVVAEAKLLSAFSRSQWARLRRRLWHRRWLRQYFRGEGVLVREEGLRKIGNEELFLDLIIVANIAAIGHELRHTFGGWQEIEHFVLLFGAVYNSWRVILYLFNMFGTQGDLIDKLGVYCTICAMSGIGLGAHDAFTVARSHVAVSSFLASAIPSSSHLLFSAMDEQAVNEHNFFNHGALGQVLMLFAVTPYLAAAFVGSERTAKNLFWAAFVITPLVNPAFMVFNTFMHRNRPRAVRMAVNIESMVEKYNVFTLVVLGETLLAVLFEGAELVARNGADISDMYVTAALSAVIIYAIFTLYVNVDNFIPSGSVHAIRYNRWGGLTWAALHLPYHMFLSGFLPAGLGLIIRDVTVPKAGSSSVDVPNGSEAQFDSLGRWMFSAGWGVPMLISAVMGMLHKAGPRGKTKHRRHGVRGLFVVAIAVGVPFAELNAFAHLGVFAVVATVIGLGEFVLIEMDRIGMLSGLHIGSPRLSSSSAWDSTVPTSDDDGDNENGSDTDGESLEVDADDDGERGRSRVDTEGNCGLEEELQEELASAVAIRRQQRYRRKFAVVRHSKRSNKEMCSHPHC